jgi:fructosamine-3-kinase
MNDLAEQGAALLGGRLRHAQPLGGGSLSTLLRIVLEDGRDAIVKTGPAPRVEARMLEALREAGVPAPDVYAVNDAVLLIAVLPSEGGVGTVWSDLGTVLHKLHACHAARYGWDEDYAFGPVAITNRWSGDWPLFWAEHRLLCHLRSVGSSVAQRLEHLCSDLYNRLPKAPTASLLHGDLWGGNVLVRGEVVSGLIDPACYFGHSEVDIAMLQMFDHPGKAFFSAYGELEPGHSERLKIYRLWPALVHLRLFGSGYRPLVERLLSELGV